MTGSDPAMPPTDSDTATTTEPTQTPAPGTAPIDKQAAIDSWPAETRDYYQALPSERQEMFWALSDSDKVRLSQLPDEQKDAAWAQIEAQVKPPRG
jgi:hypothetical protein